MSKQPNWDMTAFFPSFGGDHCAAFRDALTTDVARLQSQVAALAPPPGQATTPLGSSFSRASKTSLRVTDTWDPTSLGCFSAADARDDAVTRDTASSAQLGAELQKIFVAVRTVADIKALLGPGPL